LVPEVADRLALHDEDDDEGHAVCNQEADDYPAEVVEFVVKSFREDANV